MSDDSPNSLPADSPQVIDTKHRRGKGKGSNFFAVNRSEWERLWTVETSNRLNLLTAYLVLLAGTGADQKLTKWSAKACEQHTGMGKPRAHRAIDELVMHSFVERTEQSTKLFPQYRFLANENDEEPIFLPVAIVTGLVAEASLLRRVREAGDGLLLRMLVDLYGLIALDATHGIPIENLRQVPPPEYPARKVLELGVHAVWAVRVENRKSARGDWVNPHKTSAGQFEDFWSRLGILEGIGAIWYEPWIFDSDELDAEPLFPVDFGEKHRRSDEDANVNELSAQMMAAAEAIIGERVGITERYSEDMLVVLARHRRAPAIRGVGRLRVEADTPGRRRAYRQRKIQMAIYQTGYEKIVADALRGDFDQPMNTAQNEG